MDVKRVGRRIAALRRAGEADELSLSALALKADLAKSYLARIERGEIENPGLGTLASIAKALGVTVADLLEAVGPRREREGSVRIQRAGDLERLRKTMPASLVSFLKDAELKGEPIPDNLQRALALVEFRGRSPERSEDWKFIYDAMRMALR